MFKFISFIIELTDFGKVAVSVRGEDYPARLLTAKSEPDFSALRRRVIKSRMLTADRAKRTLADVRNNAAKPEVIKMCASSVGAKLEMGRFLPLDARADVPRIFRVHFGIFRERFAINVNFPTDTAAMAAFIGDAFEIAVIFRCKKLHFTSFR